MRWVALVALLLLLCMLVGAERYCFYPADVPGYLEEPTTTSLEFCNAGGELCCTPNYDKIVLARSDPVTISFLSRLPQSLSNLLGDDVRRGEEGADDVEAADEEEGVGSENDAQGEDGVEAGEVEDQVEQELMVDETCLEALQSISCGLCLPSDDPEANMKAIPEVRICPSLCEHLFASCRDVHWRLFHGFNEPTVEMLFNAREFCEFLSVPLEMDPVVQVTVAEEDDSTCFSGQFEQPAFDPIEVDQAPLNWDESEERFWGDIPDGFFDTVYADRVKTETFQINLGPMRNGFQPMFSASFQMQYPDEPAGLQFVGDFKVLDSDFNELDSDYVFLHHVNIHGRNRNQLIGSSDERRPWGVNVPLGSRLVHELGTSVATTVGSTSVQMNFFQAVAGDIFLQYTVKYIAVSDYGPDMIPLVSVQIPGAKARTEIVDPSTAEEGSIPMYSWVQRANGRLTDVSGGVLVHAQGHCHVGCQHIELYNKGKLICDSRIETVAGSECHIECPTQCSAGFEDLMKYERLHTITDCLLHEPVEDTADLSQIVYYDGRCSFPSVESYYYIQWYYPQEEAVEEAAGETAAEGER